MKNTLLLIALMLSFNIMFSQSTVKYFNWSNPATYKLSPSPIITGYGYYSDSLSDIFEGKTFFEHNNEYYCIDSWADYYYWFIQRFRFKFEDPQLYEYYYWGNDDYGMAYYIASKKYLGNFYPAEITIAFDDRIAQNNRLDPNYKVDYSETDIEQLHKELEYKSTLKEEDGKDIRPELTSPKIFQKDVYRSNELKDNKYQNADDHKIEVKEPRKSSSSKKSVK